jgi:uncharacterized protein (DUF2062 family)/SAM-dependent methyltransferase
MMRSSDHVMQDPSRSRVNNRSLSIRLRRLVLLIRTEGGGPRRESVAIATGVFIGCLPCYGFHLLICTFLGTVFRLNRLKMYLAANISNPFVASWLVFLEIQTGAWLRRSSFHPLTIEMVTNMSLTTLGTDLLVGSVAIGAVLGVLAGLITYRLVRVTNGDAFTNLVRLASDRYVTAGMVSWEFARRKLRTDPIYRALVCDGLLLRRSARPSLTERTSSRAGGGGTLLDIGCGIGLSLALLAEARRAQSAGTWPEAWPPTPCFERVVGIEVRGRVAAVAAAALAGDAEVITGDARTATPPRVDAVLLFDVLHMMRRDEQDALLASIASALDPDGVLLIREVDAAARWRFMTVRLGNRLKALVFGSWRQQFHFRTAAEWQACLVRQGLDVELRKMSRGTPFANVLLLVTPRAAQSHG